MSATIQRIALDRLRAHRDNPNVMSASTRRKLAGHIRRTGRYPPLIVRPVQGEPDQYQLLDGHQRADVLREIGHHDAECVIWDVDDEQAAMLLLTLNRLQGDDDPKQRGSLLQTLAERMDPDSLAALVPEDASQIDRLIELADPPPGDLAPPPEVEDMPHAVTFFLTGAQRSRLRKRLRAVCADPSEALVQALDLDGSDDTDQ